MDFKRSPIPPLTTKATWIRSFRNRDGLRSVRIVLGKPAPKRQVAGLSAGASRVLAASRTGLSVIVVEAGGFRDAKIFFTLRRI